MVPPGYAQAYARARATFVHARVYDPASKRLVHLNPPPEGFAEGFGGDINFLGPYPLVASSSFCPYCRESYEKKRKWICESTVCFPGDLHLEVLRGPRLRSCRRSPPVLSPKP